MKLNKLASNENEFRNQSDFSPLIPMLIPISRVNSSCENLASHSAQEIIHNQTVTCEPKIHNLSLRMAFRMRISTWELEQDFLTVEKMANLDAVQFQNFIARLNSTHANTSQDSEKGKLLCSLAQTLKRNISIILKDRSQYTKTKMIKILDKILASTANTVLEAQRNSLLTGDVFDSTQVDEYLKYFNNDPEICALIMTKSRKSLKYLNESMKKNKTVVMAAVEIAGCGIMHAHSSLKDDMEIALAALKQSGEAFNFLSERLQQNREICLAAITQDPKLFKLIDLALKYDFEFLKEAMQRNPIVYTFISEKYKGETEILEIVAQECNKHRNDITNKISSYGRKNIENFLSCCPKENRAALESLINSGKRSSSVDNGAAASASSQSRTPFRTPFPQGELIKERFNGLIKMSSKCDKYRCKYQLSQGYGLMKESEYEAVNIEHNRLEDIQALINDNELANLEYNNLLREIVLHHLLHKYIAFSNSNPYMNINMHKNKDRTQAKNIFTFGPKRIVATEYSRLYTSEVKWLDKSFEFSDPLFMRIANAYCSEVKFKPIQEHVDTVWSLFMQYSHTRQNALPLSPTSVPLSGTLADVSLDSRVSIPLSLAISALGCEIEASSAQLSSTYRHMARELHPDRNAQVNSDNFIRLQRVRETLIQNGRMQ